MPRSKKKKGRRNTTKSKRTKGNQVTHVETPPNELQLQVPAQIETQEPNRNGRQLVGRLLKDPEVWKAVLNAMGAILNWLSSSNHNSNH